MARIVKLCNYCEEEIKESDYYLTDPVLPHLSYHNECFQFRLKYVECDHCEGAIASIDPHQIEISSGGELFFHEECFQIRKKRQKENKRRTQLQKIRREILLFALMASRYKLVPCCEKCGSKNKLEFAHKRGTRDWVACKTHSAYRQTLYEEDYSKDHLYMLCSKCNKKDK